MILVTGATGLVGGHLIWHLLQENDRVTALKRKTADAESLKTIFRFYTDEIDDFYSRVDWIEGDISDLGSLQVAFEGINYVYHCAALVSLGKNNDKMLRINVEGTKNIVDVALEKGIKKLCFVSSIAALSDGENGEIINENTPVDTGKSVSMYSQSKRLGEIEIQKGIKQGLNAVTVNPGVILGVSDKMTGSGVLFTRVKKGMPFYTNGQTGYVDVRDVCKAMILLMKSEISSERFILVGDNCSNKDVLKWMAQGYKKFRPFIGMGKILIPTAKILELIGEILGFVPVIDSQSARTALSKKRYSSQKFTSTFDFRFTPIETSIKEACEFDLSR